MGIVTYGLYGVFVLTVNKFCLISLNGMCLLLASCNSPGYQLRNF